MEVAARQQWIASGSLKVTSHEKPSHLKLYSLDLNHSLSNKVENYWIISYLIGVSETKLCRVENGGIKDSGCIGFSDAGSVQPFTYCFIGCKSRFKIHTTTTLFFMREKQTCRARRNLGRQSLLDIVNPSHFSKTPDHSFHWTHGSTRWWSFWRYARFGASIAWVCSILQWPQCAHQLPIIYIFKPEVKAFCTWKKLDCMETYAECVVERPNFTLLRHITYPHAMLVMESSDRQTVIRWFEKIYQALNNTRMKWSQWWISFAVAEWQWPFGYSRDAYTTDVLFCRGSTKAVD